MRKTKIICTLGPAVEKEGVLEKLILSGLNIARFNFSHGSHEEHKERVDMVREASKNVGLPVALLLDTKGPEIRTGKFGPKEVTLVEGKTFTLVNEEILGDETQVSVSYKELYKDVTPGCSILVNDGLVELKVLEIIGKDIKCEILNGGVLSNNKGINVPNVVINLPALTEKDISDILFAVENDYDFIAASFVRKADDVRAIRKILEEHNSNIKIIAKIENRQGLDNVDEILEVADGIMVARGDLGVEVPVYEVPIAQKMIIKKCNEVGKIVVVATQMLDSMIRNPRPTRAEVSDVANAVYDGTMAIMLSGESAAGKYPVQTVGVMDSIAENVEKSINYWKRFEHTNVIVNKDVVDSVAHAACLIAKDVGAKVIITNAKDQDMARAISKFRPDCDIVVTTTDENVYRQLMLAWGVRPVLVKASDDVCLVAKEYALKVGMVAEGDVVVIAKEDLVSVDKV